MKTMAMPKKYETESERKQAVSELNKQRYYELKEKGLCISCRWRPAENGKVRCSMCHNLNKTRWEKTLRRKGVISTQARHDANHCSICCKETELKNGRHICSDCYEKLLVNLAKARAAIISKHEKKVEQ